MKLAYRNIPVLILGYNRPSHIKKLIKSLKKIKPKKIYISLDGPKNKIEDIKKCKLVKNEIDKINWDCVLKKNYNSNNLGCKESVSRGIKWFFKSNKFGIILEDDCIPNRTFFNFCYKIDQIYKNNKKIFSISGSNFFNGQIKDDYYFSKYTHCWGWATWSRAWKHYDNKLSFWDEWKKKMPLISREAGGVGSQWGKEISQSPAFNKKLEGLIKKYELEKINQKK